MSVIINIYIAHMFLDSGLRFILLQWLCVQILDVTFGLIVTKIKINA